MSVPGMVLPVGVTGGVTLELDVLLEDDSFVLGLFVVELFELEELFAADVGVPVTGDGVEVVAVVVGAPEVSPAGPVDLSAEQETPTNPPRASETGIIDARRW